MKRCDCGQTVNLMSFYPVCSACLKEYLDQLPFRPGFSINDFRRDYHQARQVAAAPSTNPQPHRVQLLNTCIDTVTHTQAMSEIEQWVAAGIPRQIVTVNVDFVRISQENATFRQVVNNADLSIADGKPLLWAARWAGQELPARITGMDLVLGSAGLAARRGESMFFLGAAKGIAAKAAKALEAKYPGLNVQTYSPPFGPFSDEENARMVALIRESGAKYLFVAFGAPRQDVWINTHLQELGVPICAGIGGVLNFLAGDVKRAPEWAQQCGMEWLYRIAQEPTRLWRRYFVEDLPIFIRMLNEPIAPTVSLARAPHRSVSVTGAVSAHIFATQSETSLEMAGNG